MLDAALWSLKPTTNLPSYKMLDARPLEPETHDQPPIVRVFRHRTKASPQPGRPPSGA